MADERPTKTLEQSKAQLDTLFDEAPIGLLTFDRELRVIECNAALGRIVGRDLTNIRGWDLRQIHVPLLLDRFERALAGEACEWEDVYPTTLRLPGPVVSVRVVPVRDHDRETIGAIALVEDVTERTRARAALERSEARFRALIEHAPDAIGVFRDGVHVYANPRLAAYLGFASPSDLIGVPVLDVMHPDHHALFTAREAQRDALHPMPPQEYALVRRDGRVLRVEILSMPIEYDGAPAVLSFLRDVSERHEIQLRMVQADRLAAVGTLAAGVAHEINNPLAYLMVNLEMVTGRRLPALRERLGPDDGARDALDEVAELLTVAREGAERMRAIVRDLRTFSRADDEQMRAIDARQALDAAIGVAWHEIRHRARLVLDYAPVPPIEGNEARLGQVFLNLLVNATQALDDRGVCENEIRVRVRTSDDGRAVVEVADTGAGIPREIIGRIFDPFFTTKPVGVGTGLGLSICRGIVASHHGAIDVETGTRGATFRVTLPPHPSFERGVASVPPAAALRARVLAIEDDAATARALQAALGDEHELTVVGAGRESVERLARDPRYDVVIFDVLSASDGSIEPYDALARDDAAAFERALFLVGVPLPDRTRAWLAPHAVRVVEKPIAPDKLRGLIDRLIAAPRPGHTSAP